ncbi:hypothetical protein GH882_28390 [Bacillus thuringiensis]|nr:hypothetical protein [Bacillus thuringiensis]
MQYPYDGRNLYEQSMYPQQQMTYPFQNQSPYYEEELYFTPTDGDMDRDEVFIFDSYGNERQVKEKVLATFNGEPQTKKGTCKKRVCAIGYCKDVPYPCIKTRNTKYVIYFVYGLARDYMSYENIKKFESCVHRAEERMIETVKTINTIASPAAVAASAKLILAQGGLVLQTCVNNAHIPQQAYEFDVRYRKEYSEWR